MPFGIGFFQRNNTNRVSFPAILSMFRLHPHLSDLSLSRRHER
jgi:hypothetical protein